MSMTPEEARQLLEEFSAGPTQQENEQFFIRWHVQAAIIKGPHASELAELHTQICTARSKGEPYEVAMERRAEILNELARDAQRELREKGLPEWLQTPTS